MLQRRASKEGHDGCNELGVYENTDVLRLGERCEAGEEPSRFEDYLALGFTQEVG